MDAAFPEHPALPFEQMGQEAEIQLDIYDGLRLDLVKSSTKSLRIGHQLNLGTATSQDGAAYRCMPQFATPDGSTVMAGQASMDGIVFWRGVFKHSAYNETNLMMQSASLQESAYDITHTVAGDDKWALTGKAVFRGAWMPTLMFTQRLHPRLHAGVSGMYIPANGGMSVLSGVLRFCSAQHIAMLTVNREPNPMNGNPADSAHTVDLKYLRRLSPRLALGAGFNCNLESHESGLRFGYEYTFRQARVCGQLDSGGALAVTAQDAAGWGMCVTADFVKADYKFGFSFTVDPSAQAAQAAAQAAAQGQ